MRSLIDIFDFSVEEIDSLIAKANDKIENPFFDRSYAFAPFTAR